MTRDPVLCRATDRDLVFVVGNATGVTFSADGVPLSRDRTFVVATYGHDGSFRWLPKSGEDGTVLEIASIAGTTERLGIGQEFRHVSEVVHKHCGVLYDPVLLLEPNATPRFVRQADLTMAVSPKRWAVSLRPGLEGSWHVHRAAQPGYATREEALEAFLRTMFTRLSETQKQIDSFRSAIEWAREEQAKGTST